ncbi:hypothetical protein HYU20_01530 [Candidatus Woesearchaeota archaeon]|nr:hypothetical protein [Candidatus Woesearchaeota archaeon]
MWQDNQLTIGLNFIASKTVSFTLTLPQRFLTIKGGLLLLTTQAMGFTSALQASKELRKQYLKRLSPNFQKWSRPKAENQKNLYAVYTFSDL